MTEVFVAEIGQLTTRSKRDLRAAGITVVEVQALTRCEFLRPSEVMSANDLTWAALHALNHTGEWSDTGAAQREQFARNLLTVISALAGRES